MGIALQIFRIHKDLVFRSQFPKQALSAMSSSHMSHVHIVLPCPLLDALDFRECYYECFMLKADLRLVF